MTRPLAEVDKLDGFMRATQSFAGGKVRWAERAAVR